MREPARVPRHVAIIMDGNGRWAKQRLLPRYAGHKAGVNSVREAVQASAELGVEVLTLFAFSSENWQRPAIEVNALMKLFMAALDREVPKLHKNGVRLRVIGDCSRFSPKLQQRILAAENLTCENTRLTLVVAANYGGHWDILQATRKLAEQVRRGELSPERIDQECFARHLSLAGSPPPDLFIRTGGEQRISNFLLWDLAYTELYFTDTLWPDFRREAFLLALDTYAKRQRRFGRTGDQVENNA
jgi:undecaprenyl diphosphate synthase